MLDLIQQSMQTLHTCLTGAVKLVRLRLLPAAELDALVVVDVVVAVAVVVVVEAVVGAGGGVLC